MSTDTALIDVRRKPAPVPLGELHWRLERLLAAMAAQELDELVVYGWPWRSENVRYVTGTATSGGATLLRIGADGNVRAIVSTEADRAAVLRAGFVVDVTTALRGAGGELAAELGRSAPGRRIGVTHLELLPVALYRLLRASAPGSELVSATVLADTTRLVKSPWEHGKVIEAIEVAELGWASMLEDLRPGIREFEIVASVERELKRRGAEDNFMLIAFGNVEVRGMHPPEDRALATGDLVRTEMTPQLDGYYAQICRTAVLGPPSDAQLEAYDAFIAATDAGIAAVRAGVSSHELALAQNDVLRARGLGKYCTTQYMRVRGHGVGLHPDERPGLQEGDPSIIPEGATLVIHPNTYHPVVGYIAVGDSVIVRADGATRLTTAAPVLPSAVLS